MELNPNVSIRHTHLHAYGQDYRILDSDQFQHETNALIAQARRLRAEHSLKETQVLHLHIIAANEKRRDELKALFNFEPSLRVAVAVEVFPFNFHAYRFRGRSSLLIAIDQEVAVPYLQGLQADTSANCHQTTLMHTLNSMCFAMGKAYKELHFILN